MAQECTSDSTLSLEELAGIRPNNLALRPVAADAGMGADVRKASDGVIDLCLS